MLMYLYAVALITTGLQSTPQTIAYQGTSFYEDGSAESLEITAHGSVIGQRPPRPLGGIGFQPGIRRVLFVHVVLFFG
jgi:hypothetical protein